MAKQVSGVAGVSPATGNQTAAQGVQDFGSRVVDLWFAWGKRAAIALALLVLVIILATVWRSQQDARLADGYQAIKTAASADKLGAVAKEYSGSPVAAQAAFAQAKRLFEEEKYDLAASRFAIFCQEYPQHTLMPAASLGGAYAMEASGKVTIAEKKFSEIAKSAKNIDTMAEAYLAAGRCAEAQGKAKEAESYYKSAVSTGTAGPLKEKALTALKRFPAGGK